MPVTYVTGAPPHFDQDGLAEPTSAPQGEHREEDHVVGDSRSSGEPHGPQANSSRGVQARAERGGSLRVDRQRSETGQSRSHEELY